MSHKKPSRLIPTVSDSAIRFRRTSPASRLRGVLRRVASFGIGAGPAGTSRSSAWDTPWRARQAGVGPAKNGGPGPPAEFAGPVQGLDLGPGLAKAVSRISQRSSFRCGTVIASSCTRTCQASESAAASAINTGMNSNSPRRSASPGATANRGASSKSRTEVIHDSQ